MDDVREVEIKEGPIVSITPKRDIAVLLALQGRNSGPDRIRTGDLVLDRDVC